MKKVVSCSTTTLIHSHPNVPDRCSPRKLESTTSAPVESSSPRNGEKPSRTNPDRWNASDVRLRGKRSEPRRNRIRIVCRNSDRGANDSEASNSYSSITISLSTLVPQHFFRHFLVFVILRLSYETPHRLWYRSISN